MEYFTVPQRGDKKKLLELSEMNVRQYKVDKLKQAEKLIHSKKKKGYVEDANFDFMHRFYIDSEEYGLHPKTSHPRFTEHFTEELYYDCVDEEAPFGSDEGSDTLDSLEETIRKNPKLNFLDYPKYLIEHDWGMEYIPVESLDPEVVKKLASKKEMDMTQSDMVTYATAFGQIKITGRLSPKLQEQGVKAIKRLALLWGNGVTPSPDASQFPDGMTRHNVTAGQTPCPPTRPAPGRQNKRQPRNPGGTHEHDEPHGQGTADR